MISVVIVSWNVAELLEDCIGSLLNSKTDDQLEIIVVDNASSDNTVALIQEKFPQVKLIANQYNYGFGRACNQGWRMAGGDFIFFLNPDAAIAANGLQILLNFMQNHPRAGIIGPKLSYPDGSIQSSRRRFLSPALAFVESTILQRYAPFKNLNNLKSYYIEAHGDPSAEESQQVDWLVGAALLVRREVLEQTGGFDERYFMYSEESDLGREAKKRGWQIWYVPEAQVMHREGRSSAKAVVQRHINFNSSKVSYFLKWHGPIFAEVLRFFLLATYVFQGLEEGAKFLLGHKRQLRRERLNIVRQVLQSGLRPYRSPYPRQNSELKVGLVTAEFWPQPGGVGDYTACLATASANQNLERVEIITNNQLNTAEINLQKVKIARVVPNWKWGSLKVVKDYVKLARLDAINIQYQTGAYRMHPAINFLPLFLKWRLHNQPCPCVVTTFHDLREPYLFPKAGRMRRWVTQLLLRGSDIAVVTNPEDFEKALKLGAKPAKLKFVPIGSNIETLPITEEERQEKRRELGLAPNEFAIGYFGLLNQSKGVDILLKALVQIRDINWKLIIIGGETGESDQTNRAYANSLAKLEQDLGIASCIVRTGHLSSSETSHTLSSLDLMVLPFRDGASFRRGSLLAAMAHRLPVVTTCVDKNDTNNTNIKNSQNSQEVPQLSHRDNCYLVMPDNAGALAEAIETLYAQSVLRSQLGSEAARIVNESFGWSAIATALLEVYQSC